MAIITNLDVMLAKRKMSSKDLAEVIGITIQNLSILKTGKARAIRFSTLDSICKVLQCQPGDIFEYQPDENMERVINNGRGSPENNESSSGKKTFFVIRNNK
ncbi:MAG: helix-turn-helix transcriptional regulator [Alphaproteobacteria bacterium]|nr:helix-turn-helix transcriptional regulator [Alphaproteobacteria bacterium]